jgi:hypothetical protein
VRYFFAIILCLFAGTRISGQKDTLKQKTDTLSGRFYVLQKVERDGENLPEIEIKEVNITGHRRFSDIFQYWRYERLIYNVKRVYPYSIIVREKLAEVNFELEKLPGDKERKNFIKEVEKQVFHDYEGDMREMTLTQGRILIKLIDRETQNTSYDLIKEYRGKVSAALWQGVARIFGTNLKEEYDPVGDDVLIEKIIREIEAGRL